MPPSRGKRLVLAVAGILLAFTCSIVGANPAGAEPPVRLEHATDRTEDGAWAVAGTHWHEGYRGVVQVYRRSGRNWLLDATLAPPERGPFARFGASVAIEGNLLVVGAPWDDGWKGAAYVYGRSGGSWSLIARIAPEAAVGDRFGSRVGVSAGVVSLGSEGGAVARYRRSGTEWSEAGRGVAGAADFTSSRAPEASLIETVAAEDARGGAPNMTPMAIAPPDSVKATDGIYEDRTEIRWTAVSGGPFLYKIYRRVAGAPPASDVLIRVASQDDSLFADLTGTAGVTYTYCVTVVDMTNTEGGSRCDDGRRIIFAPTRFTASDATFEGYVRLAWEDRSNIEAGYRIRRGGALLRETAADAAVFNDSTAVPGTTYFYSLVAFDAAGDTTAPAVDSGRSAFIAAPLLVSATDGQYPDTVEVTWVDNTALEVNYRVYRDASLLVTLPAGTQSYKDGTAALGVPHEYCVAAVSGSNLESARGCDFGGAGILPAPSNVTATDGTFDDLVQIAWQDTSSTEDGFLVYRMPAGASDSVLVANLGAGVTSFDDPAGQPGQNYDYCVVAFSNRGGRSAPACDEGLRAVVIAPKTVTATDGAFEDRVDLVWESTSTTAVLFKIYRGAAFIRSVGGERRAYSDEGVASGVTTTYTVRAVTALGAESPPTAQDNGFRRIAVPVSVKATDDAYEDHVAVTWTDRSLVESGFFVYRRRAGTADPRERIAMRPANSSGYDDRTGVPGQQYDYLVTAFQAYGPGRADTTESEAGADAGSRVLAAPTFVEAGDGASENQVELTWVDNSRYEEAYHVWRRNTATNVSGRVAVLPPNSNHWVDTSPAFAVVYEYSVYAVDSLGGALLGTSPPGADLGNTQILPPTGVSASELYEDRVSVAWIDQSALETSYRISRDGVVIGTAPANATSFVDNSAVAGVQYTYCVQSVSGANTSQPVCDAGQRAASTADVSPIAFTDLPGIVYNLGFDGFGASLDGEGDWLIVGAPSRQYWPGAGPVYPGRGAVVALRQDGFGGVLSGGYSPFTGSGGSMDLGADNTTATNFGMDVAISGDWVFATYNVGTADRVAILRQNYPSPWTAEQLFPLTTSNTAYRGVRVDVSGNNAVIGHPIQGVRFLQRVGSNPWSNPVSFGGGVRSVAMSGNTTLTGGSGSVNVFTLDGTWNQTQTLQPPSPDPGFGFSVDVDGDRAVVGSNAAGVAYVYERDGGGVWQPTATLQPDRIGFSFGSSVSVHGTTILVGSGTVFVFELTNGAWIRREVLGGPRGCFRCVQSQGIRGNPVRAIDGLIAAGDPQGSNDNLQSYIESRVYPLVAPVASPGLVSATDNTYRDKVQITWRDDSSTEAGFRVYRDGELIATVDPNTRFYTDFDAAPGRTYEYCVAAFVDSAARPPGAVAVESVRGCDFGRRPPDGNITGRVSTQAGAGVSGVNVCLDPAPNRSILFDGSGGTFTVADGAVFGAQFTTEFWYRGHAGASSVVLAYSTPSTADVFAVKNPANLGVSVNGASIATGVAIDDGAWHHVAIDWTSASGALHVYRDGQSAYSGVHAAGQSLAGGGTLAFGAGLSGAMDDIRVWDHVRSQAQIQASMPEFLEGNESGLAAYWPLNDSQSTGVEELKGNRYGRISGGVHWIGEAPPMNACAVSDVQGNYVLSNLRYGTSTTFRVTPNAAGHQFTPAFKTITLSTGSPVQNEVAYNDITSFTASGYVSYANTSCFAANVQIYVDGLVRGATDGSGRYAVPVSPGDHTIEARLDGHTFSPPLIQRTGVASDIGGLDFVDRTVRRLSGLVAGGCNVPVGTLTFVIESENRCLSDTVTASAEYAEALPPLKFFVRVVSAVRASGGPDEADLIRFFDNLGTREVDLSSADQTLDFRYRAPLAIEVSGLPTPNPACTAIPVPVIAQTERFKLAIRVFEDYGTLGRCPLDSGSVTVFDEIIDQERAPVHLVVRNGEAKLETATGRKQYETAGNTPNIYAGRVDAQGRDRSYQKSLTLIAEAEGQDPVSKTEWAIVTGHKPRTATFTAEAEGIPLLILHDPPGDHSFSFMESESTFCTKISSVGLAGFSQGFEGKVHIGLDAVLGFIFATKIKASFTVGGGFTVGVETKTGSEMEICAKVSQEYKTSSENLFIGRDGDVYMGLALNLIFAKTDVIRVQGCEVVPSVEVAFGVDRVESAYTYTDWHIRNTIIPQLAELARLSPADSVRFNAARENWESHLALNDSLKRVAPFERNRSFSAGAEYSYKSTVEEKRASTWSTKVFTNSELSTSFEFKVSGFGGEGGWTSKLDFAYEREGASSASSARTTGYTLADDDIGDVFSVNVKKDVMYGTPIFDLAAGTNSCPWEPWPDPSSGQSRSQKVDNPTLTIERVGPVVTPVGSPAVFRLNMTNGTESGALRECLILPFQETNPGGAIIKINGVASNSGSSFFIEPGATMQATMTVERGPARYAYHDLEIAMLAPCEFELFTNGGPLNLSSIVKVNVDFDAPCSDIALLRPLPGWSVGAGTDTLRLILTDFVLDISESERITAVGAEYQLAGTDAWLPIGSPVPAASVPLNLAGEPQSVTIQWPVTGIPEGAYSVRAYTQCAGGRNFSGTASGVIDRGPPQVLGTPQPADGTLSFGEDISITFNEDISCASANAATVRLETTAGTPQTLISQVTCNGRTLVITPASGLAAYEGQTLRAVVTGIKDRVGNAFGTRSWTFLVQQGDLAWAQASVSQDVGYGGGGRIAVNLVNGSNQEVQYALSGLPSWLTAEPVATTTIPARSRLEVAFQVSPDAALGAHDTTLVATGTTVPPTTPRTATLNVHVNVLKVPPTWTVTPAAYEQSMTVRAKVYVDADSLVAPDDVLAAFVGDQIRGVAHPQLVADGWRYFLTVYGQPPAYERVRFRVWDSRTSKTYLATDKTLRFVPDTTLGAFANPFEIRTRQPSPTNEQVIPVSAGWNWFSVNRRPTTKDDRTVSAVLSNLIPSPGDLVKAQDGAIAVFDATAGWIGTLDTLGVTKSYRLKASAAGTIRYESTRVLPSFYPIPVQKGWNWIGYTPDDTRSLTSALSALVSNTSDVLRSQTAFAEFGPTAWAGSLTQMASGLGYALYRSNPVTGQFLYSDLPAGPALVAATAPGEAGTSAADPREASAENAAALPGWEVDYAAFQYDMVVTAEVSGLTLGANHQVAALVGGEIRGVAQPVYVAALNRTLLFLMVRSNQVRGEAVHFQALDRASGKVYEIAGAATFEADAVLGSTTSPVALQSNGTVFGNLALPVAFELGPSQPNPLVGGGAATVHYAVPRETQVLIELFDINGRRVRAIVNTRQAPGWYDVTIEPRGLRGGVYFYRMRAESFVATRRMVVVR